MCLGTALIPGWSVCGWRCVSDLVILNILTIRHNVKSALWMLDHRSLGLNPTPLHTKLVTLESQGNFLTSVTSARKMKLVIVAT